MLPLDPHIENCPSHRIVPGYELIRINSKTIFVHFNRLTSNLMNSVLRVPLAGHFRFFPIQNPLFCLLVESNASIESVYAQVSTSFNIVEPSAASKSSERHIESRKT